MSDGADRDIAAPAETDARRRNLRLLIHHPHIIVYLPSTPIDDNSPPSLTLRDTISCCAKVQHL